MMFHYLDSIIGAGSVGAFWAANTVRLRIKDPADAEEICGCDHHLALHDENGCNATERVLVRRDNPKVMRTGYEGSHHKVVYSTEEWDSNACPCKSYYGPYRSRGA